MGKMSCLREQNQTNGQTRHGNQTFTSLLPQVWNGNLDRYTKTAFTDCHRARRIDAEPTTIENPSIVVGSALFMTLHQNIKTTSADKKEIGSTANQSFACSTPSKGGRRYFDLWKHPTLSSILDWLDFRILQLGRGRYIYIITNSYQFHEGKRRETHKVSRRFPLSNYGRFCRMAASPALAAVHSRISINPVSSCTSL